MKYIILDQVRNQNKFTSVISTMVLYEMVLLQLYCIINRKRMFSSLIRYLAETTSNTSIQVFLGMLGTQVFNLRRVSLHANEYSVPNLRPDQTLHHLVPDNAQQSDVSFEQPSQEQ